MISTISLIFFSSLNPSVSIELLKSTANGLNSSIAEEMFSLFNPPARKIEFLKNSLFLSIKSQLKVLPEPFPLSKIK